MSPSPPPPPSLQPWHLEIERRRCAAMRVGRGRGLLLHLCSPSPRSACSHVFLFRCGSVGEFRQRRTGNFSTSSSAPYPYPAHSQWRHHDEESKSVKVAVWWDFENCSIPSGVNAFRVPHRIISALRAHGIRGPVSITAFGDVSQLSRSTQDALYTSGVCLNHVPNCQFPSLLDVYTYIYLFPYIYRHLQFSPIGYPA